MPTAERVSINRTFRAAMITQPEPLTVDELRRAVDAGFAPEFLFFWSHTSHASHVGKECLSQWYPASFIVDGVSFPTAEHYMMHRKAMLFGDLHAASMILLTTNPGDAKELGRSVRGFDGKRWEDARFEIVVAGNLRKFAQNAAPREFLLRTTPRVLVEASPRDAIWGIGLAESDREARHVRKWRGLNLLGFALMRVRRQLSDVNPDPG
jgi:ribA/ribD-fused uncharacterized protein